MHRGGARGARSNDGYELHEPSGPAEARAGEDSLNTPLLVGEASHVAEKKMGRHRRRSAGPQTWTMSTSQPASPSRGAGDDGAEGRRGRRTDRCVSRKAVRREGVGGGRRRRRWVLRHGGHRARVAGAPRRRRRVRRGRRPGLQARGSAPVPAHLLLRHLRRLAHQQGCCRGIVPRARLRRAGGLVELVSSVGARGMRADAVHGPVDRLGGVPEPRFGVIQQVRHLCLSIDASASRAPLREKRRAHSRVRGPNSRTHHVTAASPRRRVVLTVSASKNTLKVARRRPRPPSRRAVRNVGRDVPGFSTRVLLGKSLGGREAAAVFGKITLFADWLLSI